MLPRAGSVQQADFGGLNQPRHRLDLWRDLTAGAHRRHLCADRDARAEVGADAHVHPVTQGAPGSHCAHPGTVSPRESVPNTRNGRTLFPVARYTGEPGSAADRAARQRRSGPRRLLGPLTAGLAALIAVVGVVAAARAIEPAQRPSFADGQDPSTQTAGPGGTTPTQRASVPAASPTRPATITLAFAGDVHFTGRTAGLLADPAAAFGPISAALSKADLAMVNLETAITQRGAPESKEFTFRAPPTAFTALKAAGVDIATMANNHAVDYGPVGLQDSLSAIASTRFPVVGIGRNATQAYAPWYGIVQGRWVAVLAASQVQDRTLAAHTATDTSPGIASAFSPRLIAAVRAAHQRAGVVVVYVHWGKEGDECPLGVQRQLAAILARNGADIVVGTHAHLLLGGGWLGTTYVGYGLGNFVWWRDNAFSNDTGVLTLTVRARQAVAATLTPAHIDQRGVPAPVTGADGGRVLSTWDRVRGCAGLASKPGG
jgi:poly-gamma-glutamate capsule biosynthesis protein CapA/YwtB (metallophosphatase superfamily)